MHADIVSHIQVLVEIASNDDYRRGVPTLAARAVALERRPAVVRSPVGRTLAALGDGTVAAWFLRYAIGRWVAWRTGHDVPASFTVQDARLALGRRLGNAARLAVGLEDGPLSVLRDNAILVKPGGDRDERARFVLGSGFGSWVLGGLPGGDRALPLAVPDWLGDLPDVSRAGAALGASLGDSPPPVVVLRSEDPLLGLAVATAACAARGRFLVAWRIPPSTSPQEDRLPALAWAGHVEGHDVAVALDGQDPEWVVSGTDLDFRRRAVGSVLWLVSPLRGSDPLDLARQPWVVDLGPLRSRIRAEDLQAALPAPLAGAHAILGAGGPPDLAMIDRVARWMPLNAAVHPAGAADVADALRDLARLAGPGADPGPDSGPPWEPAGATLDDLIAPPGLHAQFARLAERMAAGARCVVLLHGPPGTGKTHAARCLAGSAGLPVCRLRAEDIRGQFFGQEEKALASLFERLRARRAVLAIDEADAWLGRRTGSAASIGSGHVVECSELLERLARYEGAAVLTTNRPEALDAAVPRRVDAWIHLGLPDPEERMILWVRALDGALDLKPVDIAVLAAIPLAGGDVEATVREVRGRIGTLSAPALVEAARDRLRRRQLLG